jgi:hypothetical protein
LSFRTSVFECVKELGHLVVLLERVTQVESFVDGVVVPSSAALATEVAVTFQIVDDLRGRAFGDADEVGDVPKSQVGRARDGEQYVGVVGEERPRAT